MNLPALNAPCYKKRRIGSLHALARSLGLSAKELAGLARCTDDLYRTAKSIAKPDGSIRNVYDALEPLKKVHRKIKHQILDHVQYPFYLTGSIKGRDYKSNAILHVHSKIVINEDISGFFPSTSSKRVLNIWRHFFCFSEDVAQCLTRLTTRCGAVPQGAITSSFLANLVFWQHEPILHAKLSGQGLVYSRYVDDIAVSSKRNLTREDKSAIVIKIYDMLFKHGYKPKRSKHEIIAADKRVAVTKLSVNIKPGIDKSVRGQIRASVHHLENCVAAGEKISFDSGLYSQVMGQVLHMERFHPGKAASLKKRLLILKGGNTV